MGHLSQVLIRRYPLDRVLSQGEGMRWIGRVSGFNRIYAAIAFYLFLLKG